MCGSLGACASGGPYVENGPHGSTKPLRFRPGRRGSGRRAPREAAFVNAQRAIFKWVRESPVLAALVAVLIGLLVVFVWVGVFDSAWAHRFFGEVKNAEKSRILELIGVGMGGVLLAIGATIAHRRARAMEDTAKAQVKANEGAEAGRRQERLKNAIEHLGHESDSVRLGGAYELVHLARDTEDQTAMDILCAHIRQTTSDEGYQEKYKSKPSEEVQSLLTQLFRQEHEVFKGSRIDLQGSWLNGAVLDRARLQGAELARARLQRASLHEAHLQGACLFRAHLQGARLLGAHLQGANLLEVRLQGVNLSRAHLQGVDLFGAYLQGAHLFEVHLQGAHLLGARLQGANLFGAHLQGADLFEMRLQGATCRRRYVPLKERIREGIGQESDLSRVTFAGGLRRAYLDSIVKDLPGEEAKELREKLEPHVYKPASNELPEGHGAIVGSYTKEEAERWIAEYAEATGESPEAGG